MGNPANEIGFIIERSTNGGPFVELATALANATTYTDTAIEPSTTYSYRVLAYNAAGKSAPSNIALVADAPKAAGTRHNSSSTSSGVKIVRPDRRVRPPSRISASHVGPAAKEPGGEGGQGGLPRFGIPSNSLLVEEQALSRRCLI